MKTVWVLVFVLVLPGCALHYKSGSTCYSFETVSMEDWCEKHQSEQPLVPVFSGSELHPGVKEMCDRLRLSAEYRELMGFTCAEVQP